MHNRLMLTRYTNDSGAACVRVELDGVVTLDGASPEVTAAHVLRLSEENDIPIAPELRPALEALAAQAA